MVERASKAARDPRAEALAALYQADLRSDVDPTARLTGKAKRYAAGVRTHQRDLDRRIAAASERWPLHRMPVVDRAILRLALYELAHESTPTGVVLNEAVELAKRFSTKKSGAFVNGMLSTLAGQVRPED
ncbi:transcription antitermination factor NusB [Candidatus Spongiisocius sp.]|uniref:transcription antitermination factor NusB n=1 Tax=Candidatus Spongiisocius sp. TaxID=3101273 RepID=UPI003B5A854D